MELISLLREQNSLLRELIFAQTRQPAKTPTTAHSPHLTAPPRPQRQYTADDVFVASRAAREDLLQKEQASRQAPWRHPMETLAALHPDQFDDAPVPLPKTSPPGGPPAKA